MGFQATRCLLLIGIISSSLLVLLDCKKIAGYEFPVYSTEFCPRNRSEWEQRSSAINCDNINGYMCLPNENLTELLEFCYIYPRLLVSKDLCLFLVKRYSRVDSYNCSNFSYGCPTSTYSTSNAFKYQSCSHIENGCFLAEQNCKRRILESPISTTSHIPVKNFQNDSITTHYQTDQTPTKNKPNSDKNILALVAAILGVLFSSCVLYQLIICYRKKFLICKKKYHHGDAAGHDDEELLLNSEVLHDETELNEVSQFDSRQKENDHFFPTKACEEVENVTKANNYVIVTGRPGSGKSAIIKHIALKYKERGWDVKTVKTINKILNICQTRKTSNCKVLFVLDEPFGTDSIDEIRLWRKYAEKLASYLKTATIKLLLSCRKSILSDQRVEGIIKMQNTCNIVDIDKFPLTEYEKRKILSNYSSDINLSEDNINVHFPSLNELFLPTEEVNHIFFDSENTILCNACLNGHENIIQYFLDNSADINQCYMDDFSLLYYAIKEGHADIVQLLLRNGADINICSKHGDTPLCVACYNQHASIVQVLLSNGANVNLCMKDGTNPLYIACQKGYENIVQMLLSVGAVVNLRLENGANPLYIACQNAYMSIVQLLLNNGADINMCTKDRSSPLYIACQNGNEIIVTLLMRKADIHLSSERKSNLHDLDTNKEQSIFEIPGKYSKAAYINQCNKNGTSPLYAACQNGHESIVQLLLSEGADINLCDENGVSPLLIAYQNKHEKVVQLLLSKGEEINGCGEESISAHQLADLNRHNSMKQLLLSKSANVNSSTKNVFSRVKNVLMTKVIEIYSSEADSFYKRHQ